MKIRKILTIALAILILLSVSTFAYNGDGWSIDLSEDEYDVLTQEGITLFQRASGDNIVVQKIEQKVFGGKLTQFQLSSITKEVTDQYKELYNATVEELGRDEIEVNGHNVTRMRYKTQVNTEQQNAEIYQEMNIFVTENNLYDVIFTTFTEDGFSDTEKTTILNSFEFDDNVAKADNTENTDNTDNTVLFQILSLVLLAVAIIVIVIVAVVKNKKKKKDKEEVTDEAIKENK